MNQERGGVGIGYRRPKNLVGNEPTVTLYGQRAINNAMYTGSKPRKIPQIAAFNTQSEV